MMRRWLDDAFLPAADQWGDQVSKDGQTLLRDLASQPVHAPYLDKATPDQVISEVVKALAKTGLADVCVLIGPDNLNGPAAGDTLLQFMQKLELFQNHRLVYKLILPASLSASLSGTEAICRRRLKKYRLRWKNSHLTQLVALRFRLATGGKIERLDDLSQYEHKIAWLARSGGDFPRGWLDQARPLAKHYLSLNRALSKAEWQEVYRQYPPDLWLDEEKRQVTVGHHRIDDIPAVEWAVLRYLYQHRDRICTRDELYHNAHMPASSGAQTKERFFPKEYEGALNNVLSRLRQAIEPDPKHPLFITTYRGRGVRLEHAW